MQKYLESGQPGEIYYKVPGLDVLQVIRKYEGWRDGTYMDVNSDTIECWDFIYQKVVKFDSRSRFVDNFLWDYNCKSQANDLPFSDRHTFIIIKLFEVLG